MLIWELKIVLLVISLLGYIYLVHLIDKKINFEFIPIFVISMIANIMLLSGYLGIMQWVRYIIYIGGIGCFLFCLYKKQWKESKTILFLLLAVFLFSFLVYGRVFSHSLSGIDNYSHWALVVRRMLTMDILPNESDGTIFFQAYPLGLSSFLYYICSFLDAGDYSMCFGQELVVFACIYSLFAMVKHHKKGMYVFLLLLGVGLVRYNVGCYTLLVDTVIALVGAVPFLICSITKDVRRHLLYNLSVFCFLITIKNSGIFFVLFFVITAFLQNKSNWKYVLFYLAVPLAFLGLWNLHVRLVFSDGLNSNHAMSIQHYMKVIQTRDLAEIGRTVRNFFISLFRPDTISSFCILLFILSLLLLHVLRHEKIKRYQYYIWIVLGGYILWAAGLLGMYLFSMEDGKPERIGSFYRYMGTIDVFVIVNLFGMLLELLSEFDMAGFRKVCREVKDRKKNCIRQGIRFIICEATFFGIFLSLILFGNSNQGNNTDLRLELEALMEEYQIEEQSSYLVYQDRSYDFYNDDRHELEWPDVWIFQYVVNSYRFLYVNETDMEEWADTGKYRYLIVMKEDEYIQEYNIAHGYAADNRVIDLSEQREALR